MRYTSGLLVFEAVDGGDQRVVEGGEELGLALESRETGRVLRDGFWKDLQGDLAPEARVARAVDLTHPPGAQGAEDFVNAESTADGQQLRVLWKE